MEAEIQSTTHQVRYMYVYLCCLEGWIWKEHALPWWTWHSVCTAWTRGTHTHTHTCPEPETQELDFCCECIAIIWGSLTTNPEACAVSISRSPSGGQSVKFTCKFVLAMHLQFILRDIQYTYRVSFRIFHKRGRGKNTLGAGNNNIFFGYTY